MSAFVGVAVVLVLALGVIGVVQLVHRVTAVDATPITAMPFGSGRRPEQHALSRFHTRWYPATLLFLAFDVEMLFMYPWVLVVARVGVSAVVEMFAFLGVLMVAVVWAWREGALRWV